MLGQDGFHGSKHGGGLLAVIARTHAEVDVRLRNSQAVEEDVRQVSIVMLTCMYDHMPIGPTSEGMRDGRELDELRTCTHDADDLHADPPFQYGPCQFSAVRCYRRVGG